MKKDRNYFGNNLKKKIVFEGLIGEPPTNKELTIGTLVEKNKIGFKTKKIWIK